MEGEVQKQYILEDIMKRRRKDQEAIQNKIKSKIALKGKRKKNQNVVKAPEKFINEYRSEQKSYAHYRLQNKKVHQTGIKSQTKGKLLIVIRIRGVKDISRQQKLLLNKLNLRQVNTCVFLKASPVNLKLLKTIENYVTWGEPTKKIISQLIYKKLYGNINGQRLQIKSNELVQKHIGGDILCLQDVINQIYNVGKQFKEINQFIFPFKLTTPAGTLISRMRKPVEDGGHWGYRSEQINEYIQAMI